MFSLFLSGVLIIQNAGHFVLSAAGEDGFWPLSWHRANQNKKTEPRGAAFFSCYSLFLHTSPSAICPSCHGRQMELSRPHVYDFLLHTMMDDWCLSVCLCCLAFEPCEKNAPPHLSPSILATVEGIDMSVLTV